MEVSLVELLIFILLFCSAYSLWRFLRQLGEIRELSNEIVEVPMDQLESERASRQIGDVHYRSEATTIRIPKWDALPLEEKLQRKRSVERWSLVMGLFFVAAMILSYLGTWAAVNQPASYWLNRPIF